MNDDFLCLTIVGRPEEDEHAFRKRLTEFWSFFLRNYPDEYESVYAEAKDFEIEQGRIIRQYMIVPTIAEMLSAQFREHHFEHWTWTDDDLYSKAEASSSEWFQIPHD